MVKRTIHIIQNHALLKKEGNTIIVQTGTEKEYYPIENIDKITLHGNIQFTTQAINLCAKYNIIVIFCDYNGRYRYSMIPKETNYGKHRLKQYEAYLNTTKKVELAKAIIKSASINKTILLKRYKDKNPEINQAVDKINETILKLETATTTDEIRGYEGSITKEYYQTWKHILNKYEYDKRTRNQPKNEINTMLSFGYTILYNEILSRIHETGLCPYLSYLHEIENQKPSLALDIAEVFKQPIIDSLIFDMVNNKRIGDNCFNKTENSCLLNNLGKKIFLSKFENKMMSTFYHKKLQQHKSYRECFKLEIYKIIKYLTENKPYKGFRIY